MSKSRRIAKTAFFDGSGWSVIAKRLETGSFQLPPRNGSEERILVYRPTLTVLLAGIDFTASRRGWYHMYRHNESRMGRDDNSYLLAATRRDFD